MRNKNSRGKSSGDTNNGIKIIFTISRKNRNTSKKKTYNKNRKGNGNSNKKCQIKKVNFTIRRNARKNNKKR